LNLCA